VIWEAFRPESEPRRTAQRDEAAPEARTARPRARPAVAAAAAPKADDSDFLQREEGIY
jgi:penicillin-binding protein 1A